MKILLSILSQLGAQEPTTPPTIDVNGTLSSLRLTPELAPHLFERLQTEAKFPIVSPTPRKATPIKPITIVPPAEKTNFTRTRVPEDAGFVLICGEFRSIRGMNFERRASAPHLPSPASLSSMDEDNDMMSEEKDYENSDSDHEHEDWVSYRDDHESSDSDSESNDWASYAEYNREHND